MISLTLGGRAFSDPATAGCAIESLSGWFDGTAVRSDAPKRPAAHGSFPVPVWREGRVVQAGLAWTVTSPAEAGGAQDWFTGVLADGGFDEIRVTDPAGRTTSASVQLGSQPLVRWMPQSDVVRAQLELFAPDPLRYADAVSLDTGFAAPGGGLAFPLFTDGTSDVGYLDFGAPGSTGRVSLPVQPGTAPGQTQFVVEGPTPAFSIVHVESGRRIQFAQSVPAGASLVIDPAAGSALLNGGDVDYSGLLTRWEWAPVRNGEGATFAFLPDGPVAAGSLTVTHRAAWW